MNAVQRLGQYDESANCAPDFTLFRARQTFDALEGWVLSDEAMLLPEHEIEAEIERRGREVYRLMLQAHLIRRGTGDMGRAIEVTAAADVCVRHKATRIDTCGVVSIFGKVKARRTAYTAPAHQTIHPLDEQMQLPQRSFSYEMQRRIVDEAVRGPFDEAIESIQKTTGNRVPKRSAEQIAVEAAQDFDAFYDQRAAPSCESTGPILVGAIDGKGVPLVKSDPATHPARRKKGEKANKKKMATVAAVFTKQPHQRTPEEVVESLFEDKHPEKSKASRPEHKRVWASLEKSKEEVIQDVAEEMVARDPDGKKTHVVVTDGERALQRMVRKILPEVLLILDLLHVLERLWTAAHAFFGEGTDEATAWVRDHALMILQGKVSQVVKGMRQSATKRKLRGSQRKAVHAAADYLYRNRKHMRYHTYLAQGLPIASGSVEGACKNLIKDRMERSGMRWQIRGAEAMLKLRAIKLSGDMDEYWHFHVAEDQKRLYGQTEWKVAS
ncbi:MAG: ISKra4 family transposase, partial [Bacillota bacterium]